ncbi:hypothetical protein AB7M38_003683 [Bradyrhizobium diazoefficiens]
MTKFESSIDSIEPSGSTRTSRSRRNSAAIACSVAPSATPIMVLRRRQPGAGGAGSLGLSSRAITTDVPSIASNRPPASETSTGVSP